MPSRDKYSDPKLRDEIKEEIHKSDKGGEPGQWSARKAQLMAKEYKERGGGYTTDPKDKDDGQENITTWDEDEDKQAEREKKAQAEGKSNKSDNKKNQSKDQKKDDSKNGKDGDNQDEDEDEQEFQPEEEDEEDDDDGENGDDQDGHQDGDDKQAGQKRTRNNKSNGANKSQKTNNGQGKDASSSSSKNNNNNDDDNEAENDDDDKKDGKKSFGSRHDTKEPTEPKGSNDRLPQKGQEIYWRSMAGYIHGKVEKVLTSDEQVDEKSVKASEKEPRIVAMSDNGKRAVHKPDAMYYSTEGDGDEKEDKDEEEEEQED